MFQLNTTIKSADLRPRQAKKALRDAQDATLEKHRAEMLPKHFTGQAKYRYPADYKKRGKAHRGIQQRNTDTRQRPDLGRKPIRPKMPLVRTGLLRDKMLRGGVKLSGRFDKRKMKYTPPFYTFISAYGQIDKKRALEAINDSEQKKLEAFQDEQFHKNLNENERTIRS